ncbi:hypothetical protein BXZ70DRAFT_954158 [Cristinia sonorae]|uniref:Fungal-type protein kinase domain-containing protein n=1 Tax=Cristinia sonorae TaxID=1940300 RepID=A0A8K0UGT2_9AGAR|nr:hypothetical protein BXZ70DRAFT_954158 [Cristinia sonorae]
MSHVMHRFFDLWPMRLERCHLALHPCTSSDSHPRLTGVKPARVPGNMDMHAYTVDEDLLEANLAREPSTPPRRATSLAADRPTPIRLGLESSERNKDGRTKDDAYLKYLDVLLADKTVSDYPVADFIYAVHGLSKEDLLINDPPEDGYTLSFQALTKYNNGVYEKGTIERSAYQPLLQIFDHLLVQLKGRVGDDKKPNGSCFVNMVDRSVGGEFVEFKPDILTSWIKPAEKQDWYNSAVGADLKKTAKKTNRMRKAAMKIDLDQMPELKHCVLPRSCSPSVQSPTPSVASLSPHNTPSPSTSDSSNETETESRTLNRARSGTTGRHNADAPQAVPLSSAAHGHGLTNNDMQVVKYVYELGSHGIRAFATEFLIKDFTMTLFYMDRMGLVKSAPFDFVDQSYFLLLYLAAVTHATPKGLGFFPLIQFPNCPIPAATFPNYADIYLALPEAVDSTGQPIGAVVFSVDSDRGIIQSHSAVGRATVVVPVQPDPGNAAALDLCGRNANECLMAKISWQSKWRAGEDTHIRAVRKTLSSKEETRHLLKHIVDMRCSTMQTMEHLELPRVIMGLPMDEAAERVCRILVMRTYLPLHHVESVDEFKAVFVGAVKGHHAAYNSCGILHRDTSTNNIMFYRDPKEKAKVVGVLCDWDLAKQVNSQVLDIDGIADDLHNSGISETDTPTVNVLDSHSSTCQCPQNSDNKMSDGSDDAGDQPKPEVRFRTGTGPFMALDLLLYSCTPRHLYRHDLESFFWVLVWFVASFKPQTQQLGRIDAWLKGDLQSIGEKKGAFMWKAKEFTPIVDHADPSYRVLVEAWIKPLRRKLFGPIYDEYLRYPGIARTVEDWDDTPPSAEGKKEYQDKLRSLVEGRENIATYETFMKCIGETP